MNVFFIQQYIVAKTCQLLTEILTTVNSSLITLGKVGTMLYMQIHSHQLNTGKRSL